MTTEPPVEHHLVHEAPAPNHERGMLVMIAALMALLAAVVVVGIVVL